MYKPVVSRYSPIAPISLLEYLHSHGMLGDYLLVLGHDVIEHYDRYKRLLTAVRVGSASSFIILDNSAVELSGALTPSNPAFRHCIETLPIDCYVLPDVIGNRAATEALMEAEKPAIESLDVPYMYIPQGASIPDVMYNIAWQRGMLPMKGHPRLGTLWGVPRWITNKFESRKPAIQYLNHLAAGEPMAIHLLGMSQNFQDDIECTSLPNVIGIDSANPLVLGQQHMHVAVSGHIPRGGFWNASAATTMTMNNIAYVRDQIMRMHPGVKPHDGLL